MSEGSGASSSFSRPMRFKEEAALAAVISAELPISCKMPRLLAAGL